jgi:hypothetical protein
MNNLEHQLVQQMTTARKFFWHRLRWEALQKHLQTDLPSNEKLKFLDVGAGSGIFSDIVSTYLPNAEYYFVEPSPKLAQILDAKHGKQHNLTQAVKYEGINRVLLLDVLEHVENDSQLLGDLAKKMEPGALLAITVPAHGFLWSRWDGLVGHLRRYNRGSLLAAFAPLKNEFEIVSCEYLFWELVPLALYRKYKMALTTSADGASESEVPTLPTWLNEMFYAYGKAGLKLHRWIPFGTSVALVARKKA